MIGVSVEEVISIVRYYNEKVVCHNFPGASFWYCPRTLTDSLGKPFSNYHRTQIGNFQEVTPSPIPNKYFSKVGFELRSRNFQESLFEIIEQIIPGRYKSCFWNNS